MRSIMSFLLGIVVTVGAAYVHDTVVHGRDTADAKPTEKPIVNWDQLRSVTNDAIEAARSQWNKLTSK